MNKVLILTGIALIWANVSFASANVLGRWKTIDDSTGEVKSIVEITKNNNKLYGKIVQLFNEDPNYNPDCDACKGDLKGKKIIGMQIINGLSFEDGSWRGSKGILDPDNGRLYDVRIWVDEDNPDKLNVRGYISFLYRTQTWIREP